MTNNSQNETFWIVLKWFQDESEIEDLAHSNNQHQKFWSLADAEKALDEEWLDGLDKGKTGKLFEINATFTWKDVSND